MLPGLTRQLGRTSRQVMGLLSSFREDMSIWRSDDLGRLLRLGVMLRA